MKRNIRCFFTADELRKWPHLEGIDDSYEAMARYCNGILREWFDLHPKVGHRCRTGYECDHKMWSEPKRYHTHTARLVDIKELLGKGEKHGS